MAVAHRSANHYTMFNVAYRLARRIAVAVVGFTVLAIGVAMMVLPGPAFIVIPIGLGILGLEFAWARRWLKTVKEKGEAVVRSVRGQPGSPAENRSEPPGASGKSGSTSAGGAGPSDAR